MLSSVPVVEKVFGGFGVLKVRDLFALGQMVQKEKGLKQW